MPKKIELLSKIFYYPFLYEEPTIIYYYWFGFDNIKEEIFEMEVYEKSSAGNTGYHISYKRFNEIESLVYG